MPFIFWYKYFWTEKKTCPPLVDRVAIVAEVGRFASSTQDFWNTSGVIKALWSQEYIYYCTL